MGGKIWGEEEEKWACKRGSLRKSEKKEEREREGKCLTGERGSWRTIAEAIFTLQLKVS